jgi:outer membrane protein OmpA-like peptidoglycan-associated protein
MAQKSLFIFAVSIGMGLFYLPPLRCVAQHPQIPYSPGPSFSFLLNTAFLDNEAKAKLDSIALDLAKNSDEIVIFVGCASSTERNAKFLSNVRPFYLREWILGKYGITASQILLRGCNQLIKVDKREGGKPNIFGGGPVTCYFASRNSIPSNDVLEAHDIEDRQRRTPTQASFAIAFNLFSIKPKATNAFQQIALDAQKNSSHGFVLSVSCDVRETICSEFQLHGERLTAVRQILIKAGIDSRRIADEFNDDGTASVKVLIVADRDEDVRLPSARSVAEDPPAIFLSDLLKSLQVTLPKTEYEGIRTAFKRCDTVSVLFYPQYLNLGWNQDKGTVRLLIGNLADPQFESRLQSLDVRKYLPYACLYGDTDGFPQFRAPPSGLALRRLSKITSIQNITPSSFVIDSSTVTA